MSSDSKKTTRLNPNRGINFGVIIFLIILVYIIAALVSYFTQKHIESYQVKSGSLSTNNIYKALALRDETIVRADLSGYVNYFARETERVGVGNLVYTLDQSGKLSEYLTGDNSENNVLTNQDLSELKTDILSFVNGFEPTDFSTTYDFKYNVEGTVMKLANANILSDIDKINGSSVSSLVSFSFAPTSGYVIYSTDGYEDLTLNDMTSELIDYKKYENDNSKKQLINNNLVGEGDAVYKLATNEDWSVVIKVESDTKAAELEEEKYIKVKFLKDQKTCWGKVSAFTNSEGDSFVSLAFNNSMLTYCTDRFIDIELILDEDSGLKVPLSSIIEKEFFIVPKDYLTKGNEGKDGVLKKIYLEDGSESAQFIETSIYGETESEYYLDDMILRMGDILIHPESANTFTLSKKGSLIGVYNINKGYADFKQINILYQNDEYAIIKPNTIYGLTSYDYIVLDATTVNNDELIYE